MSNSAETVNDSGKSALPQSSSRIRDLTLTAMMAAVTCVLGPLSIPIPVSPVPISLTNLAVCFSVMLLGKKRGTLSFLIYLLIGIAGLPVFSAFSGGFGKLLGPTGGYLIGFLLLAYISGIFVERFEGNNVMIFLGMVLGTIVVYALGTIWLAYVAHLSLQAALMAGVVPYIIGDLLKITAAVLIGGAIRARLRKAGLL